MPVDDSGKGAYGTVYKAVDKSTGEVVAIKVIPVTACARTSIELDTHASPVPVCLSVLM